MYVDYYKIIISVRSYRIARLLSFSIASRRGGRPDTVIFFPAHPGTLMSGKLKAFQEPVCGVDKKPQQFIKLFPTPITFFDFRQVFALRRGCVELALGRDGNGDA